MKAVAIIFCYLNQLTLFCGTLVLHSNRIKANRNSVFWWIKYDKPNCETKNLKSSEKNYLQRFNGLLKIFKSRKILEILFKIKGSIRLFYKFLITNKFGKAIIGLLFSIYISFSIAQAVRIEEGLDVGNLVADKSYFRTFVRENFAEFDMEVPVMMVIYEPIDYVNSTNRKMIRKILNNAKKINGMNKHFELNWMNVFRDELKELKKSENRDTILHKIINTSTPFSNDIVLGFNKTTDRTEIVASRFYLKYSETTMTSKDAKVMNDLRELCHESGLPIKPFAIGFKIFEQFEQTVPNTIQAFIIATESMYLVSLLFIPDLVSAICIIFAMFSIMIGMVGFMHVWGLSLSSITMIEVIMCVGFCIDFSAHLTHAFIAGVGKGTRTERAYQACIQTGVPILNSAISTIIGVCVLGVSESYVFQTFFKTLILIMVLGVFTSMLFLPVLLSLIGPHWNCHKENSKKTLRDEKNHELNIVEQLKIQPIMEITQVID